MPRQLRLDDQRDFRLRLPHALRELLFEFRIHRDRAQPAGFILKRLGQLRAQSTAGVLGKLVGIFRVHRVVADFFENTREVADGNSLGQQVLQNALHLADAELRGDQFIHHGGVGLLEIIQQNLHVLARENFVARAADGLRQMRDQHGRRIHDGVTRDLGGLAVGIGHPGGGQLENRLHRRHALERLLAVRGVHREPVVRHELALRERISAKQKAIFVRAELEIVPQPDRRNQHAHVAGKRAPHARDALEQIAAFARVRHGNQTVAEFDLQRVQGE